MANKKIFTGYTFEGGGQSKNLRLEAATSDPTNVGKGHAYYNTTAGTIKVSDADADATDSWKTLLTTDSSIAASQVDLTNVDAVTLDGKDSSATAVADKIPIYGTGGVLKVGTPLSDDDAANRGYVDNAIQGLDHKDSVKYATSNDIADLASLTNANIADFGTSASLALGDRVLVKNQDPATENGIYVATSSTALTLAPDSDYGVELVDNGSFTGTNGSSPSSNFGTPTFATAVLDGNALKVTNNTTNGYGFVTLSWAAVPGKAYRLQFKLKNGNGSSVQVKINEGLTLSSGASGTIATSTSWSSLQTVTAVPSISNATIRLQVNGSNGQYGYFDDVSIQQAELSDGAYVFVEEGTHANSSFVLQGTTFSKFSGAGQISVTSNGSEAAPLTKSGDTINFGYNTAHFTTSGAGQLLIRDGSATTGISTSLLRDNAVTPAKLDDSGSFTMGGLTVNGDTNIVGASTTRPNLKLATTSAVTDGAEVGSINGYSASQFVASIKFDKTDSNNGAIRFRQKVSGTNTNVGFISGGKLGIGADASSPSGTLHISTARYGSAMLTGDSSDFSVSDETASTSVKYGWASYGSNKTGVTNEQLVITYVDHDQGAFRYFKSGSSYALTSNLTVGKTYKVSVKLKYSGSGTAPQVRMNTDGTGSGWLSSFGTLTTSLATYTETFVAGDETDAFLSFTGFSSGQTITVDDLEIYEDTLSTSANLSINGAADDLIVANNADAGITILSANDEEGGIYFADKDHTSAGRIYYNHATAATNNPDSLCFASGGDGTLGLVLSGANAKFEGGVGIGAVAGAGGQGLMVDKTSDTDWIAKIKNSSTSGGSPYGLQVDCQGSNTVTAFAVYSADNHFKVQNAHSFFSKSLAIGGTSATSTLHVKGNSDTSLDDCSIIIEDLDSDSGSRRPSLQFYGNNVFQGKLECSDFAGIRWANHDGSYDWTIDRDGTQNHNANHTVNSATVAGLQDGACYDFDGTNDFIQSPITGTLDVKGVSVWFKPAAAITSGTSGQWLLCLDDSNYQPAIVLGSNTSSISNEIITVWDGGAKNCYASATKSISAEWHHLVATYNATDSHWDIYLDGVAVDNAYNGTANTSLTVEQILIGARPDQTGDRFDGQIRDVKIFPSALDDGDIRKLYSGENPKKNLNVELVTNGTFDSDYNGWTKTHTNTTATWLSGGVVEVGAISTSNETIYQTITGLTEGATYFVKLVLTANNQNIAVRFDDTNWSAGFSAGVGETTGFLTATSTSHYLKIVGTTGGTTATIDSISLQEVGTLVDFTPQSASLFKWRNEAIPSLYHGTVNNATLSQGNSYWNNIKQDGEDVTLNGKLTILRDSGVAGLQLKNNRAWMNNNDQHGIEFYGVDINTSGDNEALMASIFNKATSTDAGSAALVFRTRLVGALNDRLSIIGADTKVHGKLGVGGAAATGAYSILCHGGSVFEDTMRFGDENGSKGFLGWNNIDSSPAQDGAYNHFRIGASKNAANAGISFITRNNADVDAGVITREGYWGIGTNTPDTLMELKGADPILTIRDSETTLASATASLRLAESGANDTLNNYIDLSLAGSADGADFTISKNTHGELLRIHHDGTQDHKANRIVNSQTLNDSWRSSEPSLRFSQATDGRVDLGTSLNSMFTGHQYTISTWIYFTGSINNSTNYHIVANENYQNSGFMLRVEGSTHKIDYRTSTSGGDASSRTASNIITPNDRWRHLCVVQNGTSAKIYLDGVDVTTSSGTHASQVAATRKLFIGGSGSAGTSQCFHGEIKDVRIYNRALKQGVYSEGGSNVTYNEVQALYNGESTPYKYADADPSFFYDESGSYTYWTGEGNHSASASSNILTVTASGASNGSSNAVTISASYVGTFVTGKTYKWQFQAKLGFGTTSATLRARTPFDHSDVTTGSYKDFVLTSDWVTYEIIGTQIAVENAYFGIIAANAYNAVVDIRNIKASEAGEVAAYTPKSIGKSGGKWHDETTNANHGDITGATVVGKTHYGKLYVGEGGTWDTPDLDVGLTGAARLGDLYVYDSNRSIKRNGNHLEINATAASGGTNYGVIQLKGVAGVQATSADSDNLKQVARVSNHVLNGDGSATSFTFTHNLGTADIVVSVRTRSAPYEQVECHVLCNGDATTTANDPTNKCTIVFATAPPSGSAGEYKVAVIG